MKKIFVLLFALAAMTVSAQSIKFIYEGNVLAPNDTIYYGYTETELGRPFSKPQIGLKNESAEEVSFEIGVTDVQLCSGHELLFCVNGSCYPLEATPSVTLASGQVIDPEDPMSFHFNCEFGATGETTVKVYALNQANASDVNGVYVKYFNATSVADRNASETLSAYPNPATTSVTVKYNTAMANHTDLVIKNITGSVVYRQPASATGKMTVNTANLKSGIYFYGLEGANGSMLCTKKLLVK